MANFEAKITAQLDLTAARSDLNNFIAQAQKPIKFTADFSNINQAIQSALSNVQSQAGSAGSVAGDRFAEQFGSSLNTITTSFDKNNVKNILSGYGLDSASISKVTKDLNRLSVEIGKITTKDTSRGTQITIEGATKDLSANVKLVGEIKKGATQLTEKSRTVVQNFKNVQNVAKQAQQQMQQFNQTQAEIFKNQMTAWGNSNPKAIEASMRDSTRTYGQALEELHNRLNTAITNKDTSAFKQIQDEFRLLQSEAKATGNYGRVIEEVQGKVKQFNRTQAETFGNQMTAWAKNNTKAAREYGEQLDNLKQRLRVAISNQDAGAVKEIRDEFRLLQSEARATGNVGKTFGEQFKSALGSVTRFAASYLSVYRVFQTLRDGVKTVVELDDALVDLQKTSTATPQQLSQFYKEANDYAKEYGTTTQQMIQGAAD